MHRVFTTEAAAHVGERVRVEGWLHQRRTLGAIAFLLVRDGRGIVQAVAEDRAALEPLAGLLPETVLAVEGRVVAEPQARDGVELHDIQVEVLTPVSEPLSVPLNKPHIPAQLSTILDHATVTLRHPRWRARFRVQAAIMRAYRAALDGAGFTEIQSPKLVAGSTESGANVFTVDYFGRPAFLAQSPQFYKQIMVGVFGRVYEVGPVFRAEPHDTARHINEYVSLDAELGFIHDHFDVMAVLTGVLRQVVATLAGDPLSGVGEAGITLPAMPEQIPHIPFAEAQELLERKYGIACRGEPDLAPAHERRLGEWALAEHGSEWLFVVGYPMAKRPFYTHPDPAHPIYSNSFDLLFRGTEVVTGGQRLHRYEAYLAALQHAGLDPEAFAGYLEAMRYGMPPHGGFAIGLERLVMQLAGLGNVREATLFPRDLQRLAP